jgi:RHS repeat-associated protein
LSYQGRKAGSDHLTVSFSVSGCNGYEYHVFPETPMDLSVSWRDVGTPVCSGSSPGSAPGRSKAAIARIAKACVDDPVDESAGVYESAVTDATLASPGVPFAFTRSYQSDPLVLTDLGLGWSQPYSSTLVLNTGVSPNTATVHLSGHDLVFTKNPDGTWAAAASSVATLTAAGGFYTLTDGDQVRWTFDGNGSLRSILDRNGQGITVPASNPVGYPWGVTTSNGQVVLFSWFNTQNCVLEIKKMTLPDGRSVSYTYDADCNLVTVTDLRGGVTSYTYNTQHQLLTVTDPRNHVVVTNVYGDAARLKSQTDALGRTTTYDLKTAVCEDGVCGNDTIVATDPRGNKWTDEYDAYGGLLSQEDPLSNTTTYTSDPVTQDPLSSTDPLGNTASFAYDASHNLTQTTLPGGISTSSTYGAGARVASATNARGNTTSYSYDASGNPTLVTQPGGATIGMTYTSQGQLSSVTDQAAKTTAYTYDAAGNLASSTSPLGNKTTMGYDASGRPTSVIDPRGNATGANPNDYKSTIAYNAADEVTSVTDPLGHTNTYGYDLAGNLTSHTDPNSNIWAYTYDAANQLVTVTAPDLSTTSYAYDASGNLISRTDANNHATTYSYDADNRLIDIADPLGRHWGLSYDADSNLTSITTPSTGTITYAYNSLGQRSSASYSDSTATVSYTYDPDGNRASMTDGTGTTNYTYDNRDHLTQTSHGTDTFAYTYDPVGRVSSRTYPDTTNTAYTYNDDGHISTATSNGNTTNYTYDPAGELTQTTLPNTVAETYTYNHAGQLTSLNDGFRTFAYGYDPTGNVTSRSIGGSATTYSYDTLNRLTDASGASTLHYAYDPVGNRTSFVDPAGTTAYSYDAGDQLQSAIGPAGTTNYGFDANGNETSAGAWTYAFNLANQLASATNGTTTTSYTYDGSGNRATSTVGATTTTSLWDGNFALPELALERDSGAGLIRRYTYGNSRISMTTPTTTADYSTDMLGSVTELSGNTGTLLGQYDTNPFGDAATNTSVDPSVAGNPYGYTGEYQDPTTGLSNLRARQYDPTTGRFLSPDPLGPQNAASTYAYVADNPLGYTDPSGLKPRGNTCSSPWCFVKTPEFLADLGNSLVAVGSGCLAGAEYGVALTYSPLGAVAVTAFGPQAAVALPIATCLVAAFGAGELQKHGFEGPDPWSGEMPPNWTPQSG